MWDKLHKNWFIGIVIIVVIAILVFLNHQDTLLGQKEDMTAILDHTTNNNKTADQNENATHGKVIVDVKGEVMSPGVYEVSHDVRIHHVIKLAGGFTEQAQEDVINLAQKVHDEMVIFIPSIDDEGDFFQPSAESNKIRINYATQEEIEQLNGIGPAKARAIIEYREEHGSFQTAEDLLNVSGIGEKTLENIRDDIQIP